MNDRPRTGSDKSKWAAILGSIDSPLKFFGLPVLVVDGLIALTALALPESQRIYGLGFALIVLLLVVLLVGAITFFRPENLQKQVQDITDSLNSEGFADAIEEIVKDRFPQLQRRRDEE